MLPDANWVLIFMVDYDVPVPFWFNIRVWYQNDTLLVPLSTSRGYILAWSTVTSWYLPDMGI